MPIYPFDMNKPLQPRDPRSQGVTEINNLWRLIGDPHTEYVEDNPEQLRLALSRAAHFVVRAAQNEPIVGAVSVEECNFGLGVIQRLAVDPEHQGNGYGLDLARRAVSHCVNREFEGVRVEALPSSRGIFSSLGFRVYQQGSDRDIMFLGGSKLSSRSHVRQPEYTR